jgi:hypothetical protein
MAQMKEKKGGGDDTRKLQNNKEQIAFPLFAVSTTYSASRLICVLVTQTKPSRHMIRL